MRWLLLALLIIPALEIGVFIWAGNIIGPWWVVALIILTGVAGVSLAKKQGTETWQRAQRSMNSGQVPADALIDGICIFIGGVFLFSPGFITDAVGFMLVIPITRRPFKRMVQHLLRHMMNNSNIIYRRW
ncbi:membrane protein FxsA [Lentibacillus halophilus]|uniref:Membrane protein FxsA n=1 Tax=Lentibacillus halophilus TaxID=295065 RepID=A0ABP3IW52_9BACI